MSPDPEQERMGFERTCAIRHENLEQRLDDLWDRINERFDHLDEKTVTAMSTAKEATVKAEKLATVRAEQANEWRATVNDIMGHMVTREEYVREHGNLTDRHLQLAKRVDEAVALNAGMRRTLAIMASIIGFAILVTTFVLEVTFG